MQEINSNKRDSKKNSTQTGLAVIPDWFRNGLFQLTETFVSLQKLHYQFSDQNIAKVFFDQVSNYLGERIK